MKKEDSLKNVLNFMVEASEPLKDIVKIAVSIGVPKKDYMIVVEEMWNMCPLVKEKKDENN